MPNSRHTSATDARSSTTPKFVVPLVATTAKNVSGPFSSNVFRSSAPVIRSLSSTVTPQTSASMTAAIETTDEWALSVAAMR